MADENLASEGDGARAPDREAPIDKPGKDTPKLRSPLKNPVVRAGLIVAGLALLGLGLIVFIGWWTHGRFVQGTNDAYVRADQVTVSPKVNGYVEAVYVADNQAVTAGQPLVKIDTASYDATLAGQLANVAARRADIEAAQRQVAQQQASVDQANAQSKGAEQTAAYAAREAERYRVLSGQGVETQERFAQAVNQRDQADTAVRTDRAAGATSGRPGAGDVGPDQCRRHPAARLDRRPDRRQERARGPVRPGRRPADVGGARAGRLSGR
jgi:membrane fusion protein (multidrug efflux system)